MRYSVRRIFICSLIIIFVGIFYKLYHACTCTCTFSDIVFQSDLRVSQEDDNVLAPTHASFLDASKNLATKSGLNSNVVRSKDNTSKPSLSVNKSKIEEKFYFQLKTILENASLCQDNPQIVLSIFSAPTDFTNRAVLRRTWAKNLRFLGVEVRILFPIGRPQNIQHQSDIERESRTFGDILQQDYIDSYHNLSLKRLASIDWQLRRCANAHWTVKADDDVFVNTHRLIEFYLYYRQHNLSGFYCLINYGAETYREGKWKVTEEEYPYERYPDYCLGLFTIWSLDEARALREAAKTTKFLWVEDVFTGGILRKAANVSIHSFMRDPPFGAQWGVDLENNTLDYNHILYIQHHQKAHALWIAMAQNMSNKYHL